MAFSEIIRARYGQNVFAKVVARDCAADPAGLVIANGIRRLADIELLRDLPGFALVYITAPADIRYRRIINRGGKVGEGDLTWEQFLDFEQRPTELSIGEIKDLARFRIDNDGTIGDLHRKIDQIVAALRTA